MYIESVPNRSSPPAILLRESFRGDDGKVKKRTLANLTKWDPEKVEGLRLLLKSGHVNSGPLEEQFRVERSLPHGHVACVLGKFQQLGMFKLLDSRKSRERSLAAALICGRTLFPGSKLAMARNLDPATAANTLGQELGLGSVDETDLYQAMKWLLKRQDRIENLLAKKHLGRGAGEGQSVLYDLTSTYYEGSTCVLAAFGHNRDGKKGKRQINFGLLCSPEGCPVAVEVFKGNTADPATVQAQVDKLRERFGLKRVVLVGDRGMLTSARIEALRRGDEHMGWISALRSGEVRKLVEADALQMELFDERDLAEIRCPQHFPGERLVACLNPTLAQERTRKRQELLEATEEKLRAIAAACTRKNRPYRGKDKIAARVERECGKLHMLKHFDLTITEEGLSFRRKEETIKREAAFDGVYIVRAGRVSPEQMSDEELVRTYKSLSGVERAFRNFKGDDLQVRPIFHRQADMVRAHIFTCMLAYYLQWHLCRDLKPALFFDEVPGGAPRTSPVAKARRSLEAEMKIAHKKNARTGLPLHSLSTLLADMATLSRLIIRPNIQGAEPFYKLTEPTQTQKNILNLLKITPQPLPCSQ